MPNIHNGVDDHGRATIEEYFTIDIPSDCEEDPERRFDLAVLNAREEAETYVMPCSWVLLWDTGEEVTVKRIHHA